MNQKKTGQVAGLIYLLCYLAAMLMPRKLPANQIPSSQSNFFKRVFQLALYYSGPFEPVANFLFLIPIFMILLAYLGRSRALLSLVICICCAATVETLQRFIPGRVSSWEDFALNVFGSVLALAFSIKFPEAARRIRREDATIR
ncbi:MAG: VanZ family protein [Actinobacteria bacterium]|nr:VanZ family protein [Actinomycetota bacterium]